MSLANPLPSIFLDRSSDSFLRTAHTNHSAMLTRLEGLNCPLFRSHLFTPYAGPIFALACEISEPTALVLDREDRRHILQDADHLPFIVTSAAPTITR